MLKHRHFPGLAAARGAPKAVPQRDLLPLGMDVLGAGAAQLSRRSQLYQRARSVPICTSHSQTRAGGLRSLGASSMLYLAGAGATEEVLSSAGARHLEATRCPPPGS